MVTFSYRLAEDTFHYNFLVHLSKKSYNLPGPFHFISQGKRKALFHFKRTHLEEFSFSCIAFFKSLAGCFSSFSLAITLKASTQSW